MKQVGKILIPSVLFLASCIFFSCNSKAEPTLPNFEDNESYDPCYIIRKIIEEETEREYYGLLDICPDEMQDGRPYVDIGDETESIYVEYDLLISFPNVDSAVSFSKENYILDIEL